MTEYYCKKLPELKFLANFIASIVALVVATPVHSQSQEFIMDLGEVQYVLATDGEWILERWEQRMGAGPSCMKGASYFFDPGGNTEIEKCTSGSIEKTTCAWELTQGDFGLILSVCNIDYDLRMRNVSGTMQMALTTLTEDKGTISDFLEFTLVE